MNGWWPGKVVNLMMREEGRAMAQVGEDIAGNGYCMVWYGMVWCGLVLNGVEM